MPQLQPSDSGGHGDQARLGLQDADSPAHVPVTPQPQWPVLESYSCTGRLLPGRQRILASAARQLAASEKLLEGLDVCALDVNTHALPPPLMPVWEAQEDLEEGKSSSLHRRQALELLRLHALLQAAVGEEQDLVVVGLHQVATQYRHDWASRVAAAFAAAEGQALTAIRRHMLGPQAAGINTASNATSAPPRTSSFANYEQIVPLNAYPHHNQLLLVFVHPSHLHKVTLLSIAKSRLGSYCCRDLQQNYKQQWGFSAAEQERLRQKWQQQQTEQQQRQRQQRMDLFFNFSFFGLSECAPAAADSTDSAAPNTERDSPAGKHSLTKTASGAALESWGLSGQQRRRQQRINQQRLKDCICCNSVCSFSRCTGCSFSSHVHHEVSPSSIDEAVDDKPRTSVSACGCEVYKEVFAYGGVAARLLIGATPVVVACIDLKLTEDTLERCGEGLSCRFCRTAEHLESAGGAALASAAATSDIDAEPERSCGASGCEENALSAIWRRRVIRALQRQQLLTILADIRFETDSGWASALELKPLLLLGARRQRGFPSACPLSCESGFVASQTEGRHDSGSVTEACLHAASGEQQRRLKELEQLGISTTEDNRFFYCRVPKKPGSQVLPLIESGRAAEWRRPAWNRRGGEPGGGVIARFWLRWMCCRLIVESVDADRVKTQCTELRRTLRQEGRCLSKLLVDPPLLQLPPVRPFEPMQLKVCLSNPHESLPTAYRVFCLSDSGKSIVPLSYVSYWHGALWRRWEKANSEDLTAACVNGTTSKDADGQNAASSQQDTQQSGLPHEERQGFQEGVLSVSTSITHGSSPNKTELLRGAAALAVANEAEPKAVLRRRIRLERWLLMDSLHGFLKGGETRVISMTLNIQEGIYSAQELACGVLVLRLVDSRQDFFCCLAASLMPALLGAELQPLALLGAKPLLPEASEDPGSLGDLQDEREGTSKDSAEAVPSKQGEHAQGIQTDDPGASQLSAAQLPLPKELWWLLLHIHAKTMAAQTAALEASEESSQCRAQRGGHQAKLHGCEHRSSRSAECLASQSEDSHRSLLSRSSVDSITSSGDSSQSEEEDCGNRGSCLRRPSTATKQDHVHSSPKEGLGLDIAIFLCTAGGDTLTWPSFLAGADTYLQPDERLCEMPAAAWTWDGPFSSGREMGRESHRQGRRKRDAQGWKGQRRISTDDSVADCESYQPSKRDVAFLRACLERGVAIPEGVSVCAALLLLEEWGATCCFFPSEFAVQDVQTDSLHILCRAILLSLPSVHRNAFISVVSSINELLQTAARSIAAVTGNAGRKASHQGQQYAKRTDASGSSSVDFASAVGWVGCCSPGEGAVGSECSQMCLEVLQSGERGGPAQRVNCLESLHTPQLLRHALLLWMGSWLMKSCRPALRHAVLDHFIAPV
ncbi:hypothetical protein Esti_001059 [Eimeria stiedai]